MKYYLRTANLESSMNQTLCKTDFVAKRCKLLYCVKGPTDVFLLYIEVVKILPSYLTRTSKNGKNLIGFIFHSKFDIKVLRV